MSDEEENSYPYENSGELESGERDLVDSEEPWTFLSNEEAARCLCLLGKTDSGLKYSYLKLNASDKNLTDISVIPTFRNLLFVDVSGNRLTQSSLSVLSSMTYLLMLKADRNRVTSPAMDGMPYLQVLSLNDNPIEETSGISQRLLECLELKNTGITRVSLNPYVLDNLRVLELRGNLMETTNGIFFPSLVSLYVADNRIDRIEGLETLVNLRTFHARGNRIRKLDGLIVPKCTRLSYINLRSNRIATFSEIPKLRSLPALETLVISENPLTLDTSEKDDQEEDDRSAGRYRVKLIAAIPNLKRINKHPVLEEERKEARELVQRMLEDGKSLSDSEDDDENQ